MQRLDIVIVERGLATSRNRAQSMIKSAAVMVDGKIVIKPSALIDAAATIDIVEHSASIWVSRSALKLLHAIEHFSVSAAGKHTIDIGASTGGFTQVLLKHKAAHVVALDVGHDQLDTSLHSHADVTSIEGQNARHITPDMLPYAPELIVCDASFISVKLALPAIMACSAEKAEIIALIKPQFEIGKDALPKDGVVKKTSDHQRICDDISRWFAEEKGWNVHGITPSPITGSKGNVEFLIYCSKVIS